MPVGKSVTYKDFSGGDWGEKGEFRAAPNEYSGVNVVLYTNGMLGPRAGLHENTYSGASMNGNVDGMYLIGAIGKPLMIVVGGTIYSTTEDNTSLGTVSLVASLGAPPTDNIIATWYDPNGDIYITSPEDASYYVNWTTNAIANLEDSGSPMSGTATIYLSRDRLYLAGDRQNGSGSVVYYSAAADFTNFNDGNFFEVGYYNTVRSAMESQNSLMFSTLESTNNLGSGVGWYSLVGSTPQGQLRRVNTQLAAENQVELVNADGGNIYFWTGWSTSETDSPFLAVTNGAKFDEETHKHIRLEGQRRYGYFNNPDKTLIYVSDVGNNGWMRCNGAWSKVNFEVDVSGPVTPTEAGNSFLLAYGETGENVKVYELLSRPDQPGVSGGQQESGDASNTPINAFFLLPAYQSDTKEVRVRRVIVDFMKWNTVHDDVNNEFQVYVNTYGQYNLPSGSTDGNTFTTATWSENQSLSSTDGTLDRYVARIGQQGWAPAFQIGILGMKGVAIESITVEFDEADSPDGRTI